MAQPDLVSDAGSAASPKSAMWQDEVYDLLRERGVTIIAYVPDAGHNHLINRAVADEAVIALPLTTEEEGVALLAGADLGGARAVLLMQSSGVGNCINTLSLIQGAKFPFLCLVTMRGEYGEGNPYQVPMGQAVEQVLSAMKVICLRSDSKADVVETVGAAATMAYDSGQQMAVLFGQKLLGAKKF